MTITIEIEEESPGRYSVEAWDDLQQGGDGGNLTLDDLLALVALVVAERVG